MTIKASQKVSGCPCPPSSACKKAGGAGPVGAILAYFVAGLLMYLVMVCLGE
ncbi:hypothetical protein [Brevibacillus massiliensis]|uniref:hypothetical protein n=1 Tax=Brevibacillus massiliensis TaxID=1118054 RepID=UPI0002E8BA95|nr:hypothetical protein [Brevibacillus massiliensis]